MGTPFSSAATIYICDRKRPVPSKKKDPDHLIYLTGHVF